MRGHHALIAMRRRHRRPAYVWIDTERDQSKAWSDWTETTPLAAQLQIDPDDVPSLLDLRALLGLTVIVSGSDQERVSAVAQAVAQHDPGRLIVARIGFNRGEVQLIEISDTMEAQANG